MISGTGDGIDINGDELVLRIRLGHLFKLRSENLTPGAELGVEKSNNKLIGLLSLDDVHVLLEVLSNL